MPGTMFEGRHLTVNGRKVPIQVRPTTKFTEGRAHGPAKFIVTHWFFTPEEAGTPEETTLEFLKPTATTSPHFVVGAYYVAQLVSVKDTAWHARSKDGSGLGNTGLGMEIDPRATVKGHPDADAIYATAAALIAFLRAEAKKDLGLRPHNDFTITDCPGDLDLARLDREARALAAPEHPNTAATRILGPTIIKAWQKALGTTVDGVISAPKSKFVETLKPRLDGRGVYNTADNPGVLDAAAVAVLQLHLFGLHRDGKCLGLNIAHPGDFDGVLGPKTRAALAAALGVKP